MSALFLASVHGNAVGAGVGLAIHVLQKSAVPESPEAWVHFCVTAAEEAYAAVMDDPPEISVKSYGPAARLIEQLEREAGEHHAPLVLQGSELEDAAHEAASAAFRLCMPRITSRKQTQGYIACVAAGVQRRYIDGKDAKPLLYTAQLALSAYPQRRANKGRK